MTYRTMYSEADYANPMTTRFDFAVPTNGATAFVATSILGVGGIVTRTGVGTAQVVFSAGSPGRNLAYADANLRLSAVGNTFAQVLGYTAATRTLLIACVTGSGVAAEWPTANVNNVLHIMAVFSDSSVLPNKG